MKILLIDTCGEVGSVALGEGDAVVASEVLSVRGASSELLPAIARLLGACGWRLEELDGIGVVNGPGSFTGVRVGLAAAKGLSEATGLRLVGVSRLEVLAAAAGLKDGDAVLDAGRGELYVRVVREGIEGREALCGVEELREMVPVGRVVVAEERLMEKLAAMRPEMFAIGAGEAMGIAVRELGKGDGDAVMVDANYVRGEREIYGKAKAGGGA